MRRSIASLLLVAGCAGVGIGEPMEAPLPSRPVEEDWRFHESLLAFPVHREKVRIWELCSSTFPPLSQNTLMMCVAVLKPHHPTTQRRDQ